MVDMSNVWILNIWTWKYIKGFKELFLCFQNRFVAISKLLLWFLIKNVSKFGDMESKMLKICNDISQLYTEQHWP